MADKPFDTTPIGFLEKPVSDDHNQNASQIYMTIREIIRIMCASRTSDASQAALSINAFFGDSLRVIPSASPAMTVVVSSGLGFLYAPTDAPTNIGSTDIVGLEDLSPFKPSFLTNPVTFAVSPAPGSPNTRIDIIEVKCDRRLENSTARFQLDPTTKIFGPHSFFKTLAHALDGRTGTVTDPANSTAGLSYKIGTPGNPGVAPTVSPGYVKIAEVNVGTGVTTIPGTAIVDRRALLGIGGTTRVAVRVRVKWNGGSGAQTAVIQSVVAPPGIDVGVAPINSSRGDFVLYVTGGQITKVAQHVTVEVPITVLAAGDHVRMTPAQGGGAGLPLTTVDSSIQTAMITAGVNVGIGSKAIEFFNANGILSLIPAGEGAASITDPKLEDLFFNVTLDLAYN